MEQTLIRVNDGKQELVGADGGQFYCYAIPTKLVTDQDTVNDVVAEFAKPVLQPDDILFISEKMVACTQGRAIPMEKIKPGFWARFLCKFVSKTPGGIGLGMPETMQCAIEECGLPRILLATGVSAVGKLFRQKGWFYHVAGEKAAAIDGPCHWTIPPYNHYVVLSPTEPDKVAKDASNALGGNLVLIVDLNDRGGKILGGSAAYKEEDLLPLLRQNPLGQADQSTPMGILRPYKSEK
ncbi:MAG: coenzyme F420-0:L-glutamate ligase [Oscillospiraceae bacterium]